MILKKALSNTKEKAVFNEAEIVTKVNLSEYKVERELVLLTYQANTENYLK